MISPVYAEASKRLDKKSDARNSLSAHVAEKTVRLLDPQVMPRRVDRLLKNPVTRATLDQQGVTAELEQTQKVDRLSPKAQGALERLIGSADFLPAWFLQRGAELRRTVGRIRARTAGGREQLGTGFLVAPRLLLTNAHVLDWSDADDEPLWNLVGQSEVEFDYEERPDGELASVLRYRLEPESLLLYSPWNELDYVLIALQPQSVNGAVPIEQIGFNRLVGDPGKITKGEPVFIVQHPGGRPKEIVLSNNRLIDRDDAYPVLSYEADTDGGSSGAPVYNRQWEVVALHHATQIARDAAGKILARDGTTWKPELGIGAVQFLDLNEGIRVSALLQDWSTKLASLNGGSRDPHPVERCGEQGLQLLKGALSMSQEPAPAPPASTPANPANGSGTRRIARPD